MNVTTAILCVLGIVGITPTVLSVLMLMFRAIYSAIWCSSEDESNTSFWKKYEYVFKVFLTIGMFFLAVTIAFFVIIVLVSAL